jgi:hypothetical protein
MLTVNGDLVGPIGNLNGTGSLQVAGLAAGVHTFSLTQIDFFAPNGSLISSGGWCAGRFVAREGQETYALVLKVNPGGLACNLQ